MTTTDADLARHGHLRSEAPLVASAELVIRADIQRIWELITDFARWPMWMEGVSEMTVDGPLEPGTTFRWKTGGLSITSQVQLVDPHTRLAWTGKALGTRAIHVWEFESLDDQTTLVSTRESISGWFMRLFYSSRKLEKTLSDGLRDLKLAAEY